MIDAEKAWFAMKVFQNKVFEIESYLQAKDIETYFPVRYEDRTIGGETKTVRKPIITSLIFFRTFSENVLALEQELKSKVALYRYRKSRQVAVIPDREMDVFRMVTSVSNNNWDYVDAAAMTFRPEDRVRVIDGEFKGAEGYIKRIKGNRRLVVAIEGVVAVATAYIPSCYLERV